MTDIRERLSETIRKALMGDGTVNYCLAPNLCEGGPCPCCMNAVHDVLTQLPLTQAQLEGLASGDMVVVPDNDWSFWAKVVELPAKRKKFIYDLIAMEAAE